MKAIAEQMIAACPAWISCCVWAAVALVLASMASGQTDSPNHGGADESPVDTLVICPAEFQPALQSWLDYRRTQGHRLRVVAPPETAFGVRQLIRDEFTAGQSADDDLMRTKASSSERVRTEQQAGLGQQKPASSLKFVVIVGDCHSDTNEQIVVATDYVRSRVGARYGASPEIASDNKLADVDGDHLPDVAVGRLPVDSAEQLQTVLEKTLAYEREMDQGHWRRKVNLVAGIGGFGVVEDRVIESTTKKLLTEMIPHSYDVSVTFASWSSPFCPDPRKFHETVVERLNEGSLFWVYVGHGHYQQLDRVRMGINQYPILDVTQVDRIHSQAGLPIAIFLACSTCGFDYSQDCLGEELIKQPRGPVAVLGGSRVTMPYGMAVMSLELMRDFFSESGSGTLGELVMRAKHQMLAEPSEGSFRDTVDVIGEAFSPHREQLQQERIEHVHLMHLLGDPLLRLPRAQQVQVRAPERALAGSDVAVDIQSPVAGEALVELSYRRDRLTFRPQRRESSLMSDAELNQLQQEYQQANNRVKSTMRIQLASGQTQLDLPIPADARGHCNIRIFISGEGQCALGSCPVQIRQTDKP